MVANYYKQVLYIAFVSPVYCIIPCKGHGIPRLSSNNEAIRLHGDTEKSCDTKLLFAGTIKEKKRFKKKKRWERGDWSIFNLTVVTAGDGDVGIAHTRYISEIGQSNGSFRRNIK